MPKQRFSISSLYKRKRKTEPASATQTTPTQSSQETSVPDELGDTQRTRNRYNNAAKFLQDDIKSQGGKQWQGLHLSKLEGEIHEFNDQQFRKHIDQALESQNISIKDQGSWKQCMHTMQCIITALSPFAKNFLAILSHGSSVYSLYISLTSSRFLS